MIYSTLVRKLLVLPYLAAFALLATACHKTPSNPSGDDDPLNPFKPVDNSVCVDAPILMPTSGKPTLGTAGKIIVTKTDDGSQVDMIDLEDLATVTIRDDGQMIPKEQITKDTKLNTFHDVLTSGGRYRVVHYTPLRATDNGLEIRLHTGVLTFDTEYKVTVEASVTEGQTEAWETTFKTKKKPGSTIMPDLIVAQNGKQDFCTVGGALNYASTLGKSTAITIQVTPGTYTDMLYLRDKDNVTVKGSGILRTYAVIAYANNESYESGSGSASTSKPVLGQAIGASGGRGLFLVENCNNLTLEKLTIRNTFGELKGQAETIYFNSGSNAHKLTIEDCELWSFQDTFLCKGLVYVHKSLIAGHCDYIWGYPKACLFEDCEICSLEAGYIVQARIQGQNDKGFVFLNCQLTAGDDAPYGKTYLARSGGDTNYYDNVTFIGCTMYPVIHSQGWYNNPRPNPSMPNATYGWKEYGSKDKDGNDIYGHNSYGCYLTEETAKNYSSKEAVLGADF
jgi:pectin methylesterase-like acyl-CoA thioesterase